MNDNELVKALRTYAENAQRNNEFDTMRDFDDAATRIERLAAELLQKTQQLEASQRREQAAVDALELLMKNSMDAAACAICTKDNCGMSRIPPYCNPKWRGHVAEEGAEK